MAQLKDLIVNGPARVVGKAFTPDIQIQTVNAPTASAGTTYGPGSNGNILKSNGTTVYWGTENPALPSGGTTAQILTKKSGTDFDVEWAEDKWNGVSLAKQQTLNTGDGTYVPLATSLTPVNMSFTPVKKTPTANVIAKYDNDSYLYSTTPSASDNSTKVATTAFVITAMPSVASDVGAIAAPTTASSSQFLMYNGSAWVAASLPIYDGSVS